jgi:hypothetical protein
VHLASIYRIGPSALSERIASESPNGHYVDGRHFFDLDRRGEAYSVEVQVSLAVDLVCLGPLGTGIYGDSESDLPEVLVEMA